MSEKRVILHLQAPISQWCVLFLLNGCQANKKCQIVRIPVYPDKGVVERHV